MMRATLLATLALVACGTSDDDTGPTPGGQIYVYIGTKTASGSPVAMAGLTNGSLYGVSVAGMAQELNTTTPASVTTFSSGPFWVM